MAMMNTLFLDYRATFPPNRVNKLCAYYVFEQLEKGHLGSVVLFNVVPAVQISQNDESLIGDDTKFAAKVVRGLSDPALYGRTFSKARLRVT